jgi:hypothetical protein
MCQIVPGGFGWSRKTADRAAFIPPFRDEAAKGWGTRAVSAGLRKAVRALRECPHLKIEIWGTRFCGFDQMWATLPHCSYWINSSRDIRIKICLVQKAFGYAFVGVDAAVA